MKGSRIFPGSKLMLRRSCKVQKIITFLWFDNQAEQAVEFYLSIFKNSHKSVVDYYDQASAEASGMPVGSVLVIEFEIENQEFGAMNGGPAFQITPATSFFINCQTEAEIDFLWGKLSEDGTVLMPLGKYDFSAKYGWIEDRFGVSWQLILDTEATQKIVPSLLFVGDQNGKAEEAINFYVSLFDDARIEAVSRYGPGMEPNAEGAINFASFILAGQRFAAMDSAMEHDFTFTEAVSYLVNCETQDEIDYYWGKLSAVKEAEQCGWLKDRYGVSWQIVPVQLNEMLRDPDPEKAGRAMQAMLEMKKLDLEGLKKAYRG
jgi:predicted 3-demethylubiquinone-9 3-methyltransferase (glyoxalase superfamily)